MGKLTELWGKIPYDPEAGHRGWARLSNSLLAWSNIIEDIRIERLGVKEFPGTLQKLEAVADLILGRERDSLKEAQGTIDPLQLEAAVVMGAFRDLGKGYQTSLQLATLENYAKTSPKGWALVNEGALRPLVERAIALGKDDGLGSLWLAMEVLIVLSEEIAAENLRLEQKKKEQEKKEQEKAKKEQEKAKKEQEKKEKESKNKKKEQGKKPNPQQAEATGEDNELPEKDEGASDAGGKPPIFKVGDVVMADGRKAKVVRAGLPDPVSGVQELELELLPE